VIYINFSQKKKKSGQLIVKNAFLPSLYDNKNIEIRLSYWSSIVNGNVDIGQSSQAIKGVTISHPYGPLGLWHKYARLALYYYLPIYL